MDNALQVEEEYSNHKLPEEILSLIFQKCKVTLSLEELLNCRLICKYWKNAFDRSTIMKELNFKVIDWRLFNKSTIVNKVKSLIFDELFKGINDQESKNEWVEFCNRIGSTVEKINFRFCYWDDNNIQQIELINLLVSSFIKLNELDIHQKILDILQEQKCTSVQNLVLTTKGRQGDLDKALLIFPNLVKIDVCNACIPDITTNLLEYFKARKGLLKVRKEQ